MHSNAKVALITGASGGIGSAIAEALAMEGVAVGLGYHSNKAAATSLVTRCRRQGAQAVAVRCDVTQADEVMQAYETVRQQLGEPSILIHAAGVSQFALFQDATVADYNRMMDVHVRGAFHLLQSGVPALIRRKSGRIILLSSIWGEIGAAGEVLYSTAKGAIHGLTKSLAKELAPSGITVNAIAPGATKTAMLDAQLSAVEQAALAEEIPAGRLGEPAEVAGMAVYLCQPSASYVTGQVLHVNGGWHT